MKALVFPYSDLYVVADSGNITQISNHPFPSGEDNFFYRPVASLPNQPKGLFLKRGEKWEGKQIALPEVHRYKFTESGEYK